MKCCSRSRAQKTARSWRGCWGTKTCPRAARDLPARPSGSSTRRRFRRIFVSGDSSQTPCALIVMGVSGSGKSTIAEKLAERLRWRYEDGDKFHPASNVAKMSAGHPLTDEDRWPWLQALADEIDRACKAGEHLPGACSALKHSYRDVLVHGRDDVRIVYLRGTQELIAGRLTERKGHFMPPGLLASQFKTLEPPGPDENPLMVSIDASVEEIVDDITGQLRLSAGSTPRRKRS